MNTFRTIQQFFSNHLETQEHHHDPSLRTHYYKTTNSTALKTIEQVLVNQPGYKISSISTEHGEISVEISSPKKAFLVISVISVRPLETAVDFSVTYEGLLSFGYCKDVISKLYNSLDKVLLHIGNGKTTV
jgi:hypothetical protein